MYSYFISFRFTSVGGNGFGNVNISLYTKINQDIIRSIEEKIKEENSSWDEVVIINFILFE